MSYCRWSSCNFGCDLYVYESASGYMVHVAVSRVAGKVPEIVWPVDQSPEAVDRFVSSYQCQMAFLETAERERITLPHAGETFSCATAADAADQIEALIALGYHVPDYVVEALRQEAAP